MPKHRRRKNQRRLDSKSIKNSQLKNQQLKQLHRDEQAAGDIEQKDRKDSQNEDCLEERYSEEEVEAPADVSNTSCSPADKCGNENLTIDAATAEISGTEPNRALKALVRSVRTLLMIKNHLVHIFQIHKRKTK